jgi:CHAT domain-containing protein
MSRITPDAIIQTLPAGGALVEYLRLRPVSAGHRQLAPVYVAAVLTSGGDTEIRNLGAAALIDSAIAEYRRHLEELTVTKRIPNQQDLATYYLLAERIYSLVVNPIHDLIDRSKTVVVSPDGALNLVSFAALCDSSHQYLIERFRIHYVSAARDLLRYHEPITANQRMAAFGDPDFDATPSQQSQTPAQVSSLDTPATSYSSLRDLGDSCFDMKDLRVARLPGTRREVERASRLWNLEPGFSSVTLEGSQASEKALKAVAGSAQVLHIATHGFFLSGKCQRVRNESAVPKRGSGQSSPLLLSGLLLAGANEVASESPQITGSEDGIVTAEEISSMDLTSTQWVVLSACESGLGSLQDGEGVYGVRRAFQSGGARSVICALWPVADQAAGADMATLYESRFEELPDIMQNICLRQLSEMRQRGQPEHPYLWAPFIAVGDWRGIKRN